MLRTLLSQSSRNSMVESSISGSWRTSLEHFAVASSPRHTSRRVSTDTRPFPDRSSPRTKRRDPLEAKGCEPRRVPLTRNQPLHRRPSKPWDVGFGKSDWPNREPKSAQGGPRPLVDRTDSKDRRLYAGQKSPQYRRPVEAQSGEREEVSDLHVASPEKSDEGGEGEHAGTRKRGRNKDNSNQRQMKEPRETQEASEAARFAASKLRARFKRLQKAESSSDSKGKIREVFLPQLISISNLALLLGVKMRMLQCKMKDLALQDFRPDALLRFDDASLICAEYDLNAVSNDEAAFDIYPAPFPSAEERAKMPFRPPVVTVMGHVDHGKTSLLDRLRSASVAAGEAGGITQHIGAFSVSVKNASDNRNAVNKITFLDTPGHAAFSSMRARGAKATDIIILVVAADDGVMEQTKEVISLYQALEAEAQASAAEMRAVEEGDTEQTAPNAGASKKRNNIQLIVALSKCDKPEADAQKVIEQLGAEGVYVENLGGEVPSVEISSKTGQGFEDLEETLAAMAELADLRAVNTGQPEGLVLESRTEKGRGNTATVLITRGALTTGNYLVCGHTWAKVRQMVDSNGKNLKSATPGDAVLVSGWKNLPVAGDEVLSAKKEEEVKKAVANRKANAERIRMMREAEAVNEARRLKSEEDARAALVEYRERARSREYRLATAEGRAYVDPFKDDPAAVPSKMANLNGGDQVNDNGADGDGSGERKELRLIIKSDFSGTSEALVDSVSGIATTGACIKILHMGVGEVTEGDLALARTAGAHILAFNVVVPRSIEQQAAAGGLGSTITIYKSAIIYEIIAHVSKSLAALLPPIIETRVVGEATVAQKFNINVKARQFQSIAGCRVINGVMDIGRPVRILRKKSRPELDAEGYEAQSGGDEDEQREGSRKVVWQGVIEAMKHVKKDVREMRKGTECGISFEGFQDFMEGDVVQTIETVEKPRYL